MEDQIKTITSSEYYEGDFGHEINIHAVNEFVQDKGNLVDYVHFLKRFGYGELDASFYLEDVPILWSEVFPKEKTYLEGLYIFATDQSEYSFAFDTKNECKVVEISAGGEVNDSDFGFFHEFISSRLDRLVKIVSLRCED